MTDHQRFLALAAASIDFRLTPEEQHALRTHLAECDSCSLTVRALLDDSARLAAVPQPPAPAAVRDALIRASTRRPGHGGAMRWPLVAAMLAVLVVAGTFVAGSVVDRLQARLPAPSLATVDDHPTPDPRRSSEPSPTPGTTPTATASPSAEPLPSTPPAPSSVPQPSADLSPRPTPSPRYATGWNDVGDLTDQFGGRSVVSVMAGPDGGLVAFGLDRTTTDAVVWQSQDGTHWTETSQPSGVFGGGGAVPTTGGLGGAGIVVLGWATSTEGRQRAIWSSPDGRDWSHTADLGVASEDLTLSAGPAGLIVWAPSGRAWASEDGTAWRTTDIGRQGVTDVAVDEDGYVAVGRTGSLAFLATSTDGRSWGTPRTTSAGSNDQVGIERADDGVEAVWIGEQRWRRSGSTWRAIQDATVPRVPDVASIVGGASALGAVGTPTSAGAYRAWTWDGTGDWSPSRVDAEAGSGTPAVVDIAQHGDGWFVLTRRGGDLHGWIVEP